MKLNKEERLHFDIQVDQVLQQLPQKIVRLLDVVPLYVEDYPSRQLARKLKLTHRNSLCGCFVGPTINQQLEGSVASPGFITLFRRSLLLLSTDTKGQLNVDTLREEIKITILHELAHYHGIDEGELVSLGYA